MKRSALLARRPAVSGASPTAGAGSAPKAVGALASPPSRAAAKPATAAAVATQPRVPTAVPAAPSPAAAASAKPAPAPVARSGLGARLARPALAPKPLLNPPAAAGAGAAAAPAAAAAAGATAATKGADATGNEAYFTVLYCQRTSKKHKSYLDGVMISTGNKLELKSNEDKFVARRLGATHKENFGEGSELFVGNWDVVVQERIPAAHYLSGRVFLGSAATVKSAPAGGGGGGGGDGDAADAAAGKKRKAGDLAAPAAGMSGASAAASKPFKRLKQTGVSDEKASTVDPNLPYLKHSFRYDPVGPDAIVLNKDRALKPHAAKLTEYPVCVDPHIGRVLRPHQVEGVQFLYDCLMGVKNSSYLGCILADSMGLGKSLQIIALVWTLVKAGPKHHAEVTKCCIVCPSSLVSHWTEEFKKWLGNHRLQAMKLESDAKQDAQRETCEQFVKSKVCHVLVISYEMVRKHIDTLRPALGASAMVVCDEGHRLKNSSGNKTIQALASLGCRRRVILSGTPIQNNLSEFFAMCEFVNPTMLGGLQQFRNTFEKPITLSRDTKCNAKERQLGEQRSQQLTSMTATFVLRRTADILAKYLPPRVEQAIFCRLSPLQVALYRAFLKSKAVTSLVERTTESGAPMATALSCITSLRKVVNDPTLVYADCVANADAKPTESQFAGIAKVFPAGFGERKFDASISGKMACLEHMLAAIHQQKGKVVVVSNFRETLDVIEELCTARGYNMLRLDGETPQSKRGEMVARFNSPSNTTDWVFLLSARAGGVGLNLIGGNRLILFDPDWNPATDLQAMGRVWRDGQKHTVYVYRLLAAASIDEKIFQRQLTKQEVQAVMDEQDVTRHFTRDQLRALFRFAEDCPCDTANILRAKEQSAAAVAGAAAGAAAAAPTAHGGGATDYQLIPDPRLAPDPLVQSAPPSLVTFVFHRSSTDPIGPAAHAEEAAAAAAAADADADADGDDDGAATTGGDAKRATPAPAPAPTPTSAPVPAAAVAAAAAAAGVADADADLVADLLPVARSPAKPKRPAAAAAAAAAPSPAKPAASSSAADALDLALE